MSRARAGTLTAAAAVSAAIVMLFFFKAPPIPVAIGGLGAIVWIFRRRLPQ